MSAISLHIIPVGDDLVEVHEVQTPRCEMSEDKIA